MTSEAALILTIAKQLNNCSNKTDNVSNVIDDVFQLSFWSKKYCFVVNIYSPVTLRRQTLTNEWSAHFSLR